GVDLPDRRRDKGDVRNTCKVKVRDESAGAELTDDWKVGQKHVEFLRILRDHHRCPRYAACERGIVLADCDSWMQPLEVLDLVGADPLRVIEELDVTRERTRAGGPLGAR